MMREGGQNLEVRVRRLEAEVEGHERELERLRLSLAPPRDDRAPVRDGLVPEAAGVGVSGEEVVTVTGQGGFARGETDRSLGGAWRGLEFPFELAKLRRWEWWMNKVGIALFLMGVVFLFKFSWGRGWLQVLLTPAVRVGLGILLGTALV